MPGGGQKVSFASWSGVWRWKDGAGWSQSRQCLTWEPFWAGLRCCWICFYSSKMKGWKKKSSKVTESQGKWECLFAVTQQDLESAGWATRSEETSEPIQRGRKRSENGTRGKFGRVQPLKMDGGSRGWISWLSSGLKTTHQCPYPSPRSCWKSPHGLQWLLENPLRGSDPRPSSLSSDGFVPSCSTEEKFHLYDALKHRALSFWAYNWQHKITLMVWPWKILNRKFKGKFWNPKTPHFLESSGKKIMFSIYILQEHCFVFLCTFLLFHIIKWMVFRQFPFFYLVFNCIFQTWQILQS